MNESNYWQLTAPTLPSYASKPLPVQTDAVVIGGGYTGLLTAYHLAQKGAQVTLLERETIGWGASSRNGGMVLSGLKISAQTAVQRYGMERAKQLVQASRDSIDCVEAFTKAEGIECDFRREGALAAAYKPSHFAHLRETHELLKRAFGHETVLVSRGEQQTEIGSSLYHGGLVDPQGAGLHPGKYVAGLAGAAARAGVDLHDGVEMRGLRKTGAGFEVVTKRGTVAAKQVMVATNGYTGAGHRGLQRRMIPVGSHIIVTEPLSEDLAREVSPRNRMIWDTKNFLYYFRLTPDRRMLFGGRASFVPSTPETNRQSAEILRRGMLTVYPQLAGVKVEYVWGGTLGFTMDRMPHAGEMGGVFYAMGYAGHGVAMATLLGQRMAEVMDGHPEANPFHDLPFTPVPFYTGWPWFLPFAGAYYKVLDWLT